MQVVMLPLPTIWSSAHAELNSGKRTFLIFESYLFPEPYGEGRGCQMSLTEVCALLTVVIGLLTLLVTVAKASFDAGWKISHDRDDKNKKDWLPPTSNSSSQSFWLTGAGADRLQASAFSICSIVNFQQFVKVWSAGGRPPFLLFFPQNRFLFLRAYVILKNCTTHYFKQKEKALLNAPTATPVNTAIKSHNAQVFKL